MVVIAGVAFGALPIFARIAFGDGVDPFTLLALRFLVAGSVMTCITFIRGEKLPKGRTFVGLMLMGGVLYVGQSLSYFIAITKATVGLISLLLFLNPAIVTLLSVIFIKEKIGKWQWVALILAVTGTAFTIGGDVSGSAEGIALGFAAGIIYAIYITIGGFVTRNTSVLSSSAVIMISAFFSFGALTLINGVALPHTWIGWAGITGLSLISTVIAIVCFFRGVQLIGASKSAVLATTEPVTTISLAAVILYEPVMPIQMFGGALILISVVLLALLRK